MLDEENHELYKKVDILSENLKQIVAELDINKSHNDGNSMSRSSVVFY
jgi:hypothetical protein